MLSYIYVIYRKSQATSAVLTSKVYYLINGITKLNVMNGINSGNATKFSIVCTGNRHWNLRKKVRNPGRICIIKY